MVMRVDMTDAEIEQAIIVLCSLAQELPLSDLRGRSEHRSCVTTDRRDARVRAVDALQDFIIEALRLEALGR